MKGMQKLKASCHKSLRGLKHASPVILACIAVAGVVGTAVMAAKAHTKAQKLLQEAAEEKGETLNAVETIRVAVPVYAPAVLAGAATISCILGANALNKRQQAAMASAYIAANQTYHRYRKAANAVYGKDADSRITAQVAKDVCVTADGNSIYSPDMDKSGDRILFYDSGGRRYFSATIPAVLNAMYHLNRNLTLRGDATLNEFYEFIGIDKIDGGDDLGWDSEELLESGLLWLDFSNSHVKLDDGMECCVITAAIDPAPLGCYVPF